MRRLTLLVLTTLVACSAVLAVPIANPSRVSAIANPDFLSVNGVHVYVDCLESGDVGVLVDYNIDYAVLPTETATDAYLVSFIDTDGVTQLKAVSPYSYIVSTFDGYNRGMAWIYFTAAEAATYSLDAVDKNLYSVWVMGNPTVPSGWPGAIPKWTAPIDYWQTSGDTAVLISLLVLTCAAILEPLWAPLDMIQTTPLGNRLGTYGEGYFENVISNLRVIAPAAFAAASIDPVDVGLSFDTGYGATMTNGAAPTGGTVTGSPITFTAPEVSGIVDAGTNVSLDDAVLTQADDYWNGSRLIIISTTDGLAPQGETALITNFAAATDRLSFAALTAAVGAGDTYSLCTGTYSTADAGTTTTIDDPSLAVHNLALIKANNYWNGAVLRIISTTDGAAPEGETSVITGFAASTNRLTFGALTAVVGAGDTYVLSFTSVDVTVVGTFTLELAAGTAGIITNNTGTVTGSPVSLVAGSNDITVTVIGLLTVSFYQTNMQSRSERDVRGTAFDLSDAAAKFGMSRMWFSTLVWLIMSILVCAAVYRVSGYGGGTAVGLSSGKLTLLVFYICIIGGTLLGLVSYLITILLFLFFGVFIGYILFFRQANA